MKIVILDGYTANPGDLSWKALEEVGEVTIYERTSPQDVIVRAKDADIVLTNKVCFGKEELAQLPHLKYIGVTGTGYNVIDVNAAHERGIIVTNVPAYSTDSVAQMVFAHLLTVTNRVEHYSIQNRNGKWSNCADFSYSDTPLTEIAGKTIGILGLGNIGQRVATIALAFGMNVLAMTSKPASSLMEGITKVAFEDLLMQSDILTLHCPLTPETHHIINADSLQMMKPSAILINTGRGPLIDEQAVANALKTNRLLAYCTDVMGNEPPSINNPLLQCPNAYITPHIAWATREARIRLLDIVIDNVKAFVSGKPTNVV